MFSIARSRAYDSLPGPIVPAQPAMEPEKPGFEFFSLPAEIQENALLKIIFDIASLARFRITCKAANALVSDFQNRIALLIGCPDYPHSTLPRPIQVLHFIDRVRSRCRFLREEKEPTPDAIVLAQKNLREKQTDRKFSGIVKELKNNFENLEYEWPKASELTEWGRENINLIEARDKLIFWHHLAQQIRNPNVPNIKEVLTVEALIEQTNQFSSCIKEQTKLKISSCALCTIPKGIGQLLHLAELDLENNCITELPSEIAQLSNLVLLNISNNELKSLPAEIGKLSKLRELFLNNNDLEVLPEEMSGLRSLSKFEARNNHLSTLPSKFGYPLQRLNLTGNQFSEFPDRILQMQFLIKLVLRNNYIRALPDKITECFQLSVLDLSDNLLTLLPSSIGSLQCLSYLFLSRNRLRQLPSELGKLADLEMLTCRNNLLTEHPKEIFEDYYDLEISAEGNPFTKNGNYRIKN